MDLLRGGQKFIYVPVYRAGKRRGHDGVWNSTADDIAEYYIANYYDHVVVLDRHAKVQA